MIKLSKIVINTLSSIKRNLLLFFNWFLPGCRIKPFLKSSLHAIWMIAFSLLWLVHINMFDGFDFMNDVMDYRDLISKNIFNRTVVKDINKKYLLINTSQNNQLLAGDNDNQVNFVITDRKELCRVLKILNNNSEKFRYIICDIIFDDPDTINDTALQDIITRLDQRKKIILPFYIVDADEDYIYYPIFKANRGLSQYRFSFLNTQFLKFTYISYDTLKQLPLIAFENITGKKMSQRNFLGIKYYTIDNKWCLNTIIPEFRYTSSDLIPDETYYDLGFFREDFIGENQVVFIGDFEGIRDRHHSIVDQVAGPLIVLNALESLVQGDNLIGIPYLFMLFFFFLIISYHTFYKGLIKLYYSERKKPNNIAGFVRSRINYLTILMLTLVSMLFFHHYFHLLILLGYFACIDLVIWLIDERKRNKVIIS